MKKFALLLTISTFIAFTSCSVEDTNILPNQQKNSELSPSLKRVIVSYANTATNTEKEELKNEFVIKQIIQQDHSTEAWLLQPTYDLAIIEEVIAMNTVVDNVSIDNDTTIFEALRDEDATGDGKDNGEEEDTSDQEKTGDGKDNGEEEDTSDQEKTGDGKDNGEEEDASDQEKTGDGKDNGEEEDTSDQERNDD